MTFYYAKQLHKGDEVIVKVTGAVLLVISVSCQGKTAILLCNAGNEYHHKDVE